MLSERRLYPPLAALRAFEAVGRLGGIRRAARELATDHGTVSRHVRTLEAWIGLPLLSRAGMDRTLTPSGSLYYQEISSALRVIAMATGSIMGAEGASRLTITCMPGFAALWLADRIVGFINDHPEIHVGYRPANEVPDFRSTDVDCDVRYIPNWSEEKVPAGVRRFEFARPAVFPVASPALLASLPPLETARDLQTQPLLHEESDEEWKQWFSVQGIATDGELPGSRLWNAHLALKAARQGHGFALANPMLLGDDLETGRLVKVQPANADFTVVHFGTYALLVREERWNTPAVFLFRRWIQRQVGRPIAALRSMTGE